MAAPLIRTKKPLGLKICLERERIFFGEFCNPKRKMLAYCQKVPRISLLEQVDSLELILVLQRISAQLTRSP